MSSVDRSRTFRLGELLVKRLGYGAMRLSGPGIFGPPRDRGTALAVLREAVSSGVNHIDTSDYYGPHITNQLIHEALHPYPEDLVIVTKIGARRGEDASWLRASSPAELTRAVHDNLRNLSLDVLDVVNLRNMLGSEASIEAPLAVLADLQRQGLLRHIGLSNVTPAQVGEGRRICEIACVQNHYNVAHRDDDALIDDLAGDQIAYVPFFPLGGFTPLQSSTLSGVAQVLARRRCKSRSRGYFAGRQTYFSFQARRRWRIFGRTSRQRSSISRRIAYTVGRRKKRGLLTRRKHLPGVGQTTCRPTRSVLVWITLRLPLERQISAARATNCPSSRRGCMGAGYSYQRPGAARHLGGSASVSTRFAKRSRSGIGQDPIGYRDLSLPEQCVER